MGKYEDSLRRQKEWLAAHGVDPVVHRGLKTQLLATHIVAGQLHLAAR